MTHPNRCSNRLARSAHPAAAAIRPPHSLPRRTAIATAVAMTFGVPVHAQIVLPTGGTVVGGNGTATITTGTTTLTVNQAAQNAIINWQGFSIGAGGSVNFVQPNTSSIALNRVTGNQVSQIDGALNANGRVFLVNTNGVLFSAGSQVNVGGIVASSLNITDADFNAGLASGKFSFGDANGYGGNMVQNSGRIIVNNGGDAALIGRATNAAGGSITADRGNIEIANAPQAVLDFNGDGLTRLVVSSNTINGALSVGNAGTLQADGGTVSMQGVNPSRFFSQLVVSQTGVVRARTLDNVGGRIILSGGPATANSIAGGVAVSGTLDASATVAGQSGGSIVIDGEFVNVGYTATTLNATGMGSGANGTLAIGANSDINIVTSSSVPDPSYGGSTSYIADAALASAASNGTNTTIASRISAATGYGGNVTINNANVATTQTRDASIRLDAARNIQVTDSTLTASGAALNLDLDANSNGTNAGSINVDTSTLATNGGSVRMFGQGDAVNGRASGNGTDGIAVTDSTIDTRDAAGGAAGAVTMRGLATGGNAVGAGVNIGTSDIRTANGDITLDGIGTIGAPGVIVTGSVGRASRSTLGNLTTTGGNIAITGVSTNQTDPAQALANATPIGVALGFVNIASGGDVTIRGTGGDVTPSVTSAEASGGDTAIAAGDGVYLLSSAVSAGASRRIDITGTAGGIGLNQTAQNGNTPASSQELAVAGIRQMTSAQTNAANVPAGVTLGLRAAGGVINLTSGNGDIAMDTGASTANTAGAGGSIQISGDTLHLLGTATQGPVFDSSGTTTNGTVSLTSKQDVVLFAQANVANQPASDGNSYISDGAINSALNTSSVTNVTSTTGQLDVRPGVALLRSAGTAPAALNFTSNHAFFGGVDANGNAGAWSLKNTVAPLDVTILTQSSTLIQNAVINTNGGNFSATSVNSNDRGIDINAATIDTRIGQSANNASGSITLNGTGQDTGIETAGANLQTSTGAISLTGHALNGGEGVGLGFYIPPNPIAIFAATPTTIQAGSGNVSITGIAENGAANTLSNGVLVGGATVGSTSGRVDIAGYSSGQAAPANNAIPSAGVAITGFPNAQGGPLAASINGSAGVSISGSSTTAGPGIYVGDLSTIASNGPVVLRAQSGTDGSAPIQMVGSAQVTSNSIIDVRPGGVTAAGAAFDSTATPITIGTGTGFVLGTDLFTRLAAPTVAIGSSAQTGEITVNAPLTTAGNLTLQNSGAGGIALNGAVNVGSNVLALVSGGNITQTAALTARSLLATSSGGSVTLDNAGNTIQANTLAGSAAGDFTYINSAALSDGTVTANGIDAASNTVTALSATGVAAGGNVLLQNLAGNFTLNGPVSGAGVDIVTAGLFQNTSASAITAANGWRVWASTFNGENRGGLAGSGPLPNLYGCSFGGACGVTVSPVDNHFIYAQQPTLNVNIDNLTREYGLDNPALTYVIAGLLQNGDTAAGALSGTLSTLATIFSNVGNYAINNNFTSPAGYRLAITPGALAITPATLAYVANTATREYGLDNPLFSGTVTGFRNNDTQGNATTGALLWSSPAVIGSNVGVYAINGSGLGAQNYVFVQAPGNASAFNITQATLNYVANGATREYGVADPLFSGVVTGFRLNDNLGNATTGNAVWTSPAAIGSNVGQYAINGSGLGAQNYRFVQAPGNASAFNITQATLTYVADGATREYGLDNPLFSGNVTGFRLNDSVGNATTGSLLWSSPAVIGSNVGQYAITGAGLSALNYRFVQAPSNATALNITQATLTYVSDPVNRPLGSPNPALGGTVTGFRNGDTQQDATNGTLMFSTAADRGSPLGSYGIFGSGLDALNYKFVQAPSNATILAVTDVPVSQQVGVDYLRELPMTYLYDRNLGIAPACPTSTTQDAETVSASSDSLTHEWSLVRTRPNLSSCVQKDKKNGCSSDF